jgi:hypothetical protein
MFPAMVQRHYETCLFELAARIKTRFKKSSDALQ